MILLFRHTTELATDWRFAAQDIVSVGILSRHVRQHTTQRVRRAIERELQVHHFIGARPFLYLLPPDVIWVSIVQEMRNVIPTKNRRDARTQTITVSLWWIVRHSHWYRLHFAITPTFMRYLFQNFPLARWRCVRLPVAGMAFTLVFSFRTPLNPAGRDPSGVLRLLDQVHQLHTG